MTLHISSVDLDHCAQEPIHIPGAIQPHGCLMAFDPHTLVVHQVSANVEAFLGLSPAVLLNSPFTECLPRYLAELLLRALSGPSLVNPISIEVHAKRMDGVLHEHEGVGILEIELVAAAPVALQHSAIDNALKQLSTIDDLHELVQTTVQVVRDLTGFDRVLIYRFDEDGHGEVVSESKADDIEAYLGLHYPESDIPRQARELYLRNWIRTIPDGRYEPVPLVPALRLDTGRPLDLTHSTLRSVSPVHLQYMANMGLQASMSVSLIVKGRLWGLISCGHRQPRGMSYRLRSACETIGRMVSLQISALQALDLQKRQAAKSEAMLRLAEVLHHADAHGLAGLPSEPHFLLDIAQSAGAAVVSGETVCCVASCPATPTVLQLSRWVSDRASANGLFSTRQLSNDDPRWHACADLASGVLAIVLPTPIHSCVMWFRPEMIHTVDWAGNPNKTVEKNEVTKVANLHPRHSFQLWKEEVRGRSLPWGPAEVHAVLDLRRSAIEIDLYRQVQKAQAAVKARDDLVAVVVHDLRTPLSVVVMQAVVIQRLLALDLTETSQRLKTSAQTIRHAAERMASLVNDLLDLAKIEAGRFKIAASRQSATLVIQDAYDLLHSLGQSNNVVLVLDQAPNLAIWADPERLFQVLSNLIGNSFKFSSKGGQVHVSAAEVADGMCEFSVTDSGAGISPEQLPRIFDRFWQGKPTDAMGAGLGLHICQGIVEAHGGRIRAESRPGHGTTVFFTVPLDLND